MSVTIPTQRHTITPSPISHVSGNACTGIQATPDTAITPTSFFSHPSSPYTSASSSASFRPSHQSLPRLQIPFSSSKMVAETRGSKRKYQNLSPNTSPEPANKTRALNRQDIGVQVGSPRDDSMLEIFNMKWRDYHQEMAHIKEAMLENEAKLESQREDSEKWRRLLLQSETDNTQLREKLQKAEALLKEYDIPKEKWP